MTNVIYLYKALVRSHLESTVQAWARSLKKDIIRIEGMQRRAVKLIPALRNKLMKKDSEIPNYSQ